MSKYFGTFETIFQGNRTENVSFQSPSRDQIFLNYYHSENILKLG